MHNKRIQRRESTMESDRLFNIIYVVVVLALSLAGIFYLSYKILH